MTPNVKAKHQEPFIVGIPVYNGVDLLDVAAPCEVFSWLADEWVDTREVKVYVLSETNGPVMTRGGLQIIPHKNFDEVKHLDLLWVPGGDPVALKRIIAGSIFLDHLRAWAKDARFVTSVCEGALLLDAAGLLDGFKATTHWAFITCLEKNKRITVQGPKEGYPRYVVDPPNPSPKAKGVRVTGAGVSAGLDEALKLVALLGDDDLARKIMIDIQYFPDPPVVAKLTPAKTCPMDSLP